MLLADALALAQRLAVTKEKHCNYDRVVELRRKYKALITGENAEYLLQQFIRREDDEAFQQRVNLTISITPAVCAALMKPFNKVSRNNKVKKNFDFKSPVRNDNVETMRGSYYGRKKSKNKGLDYWLKNRYPILTFIDPNSFVAIEWDAPQSRADVIVPRPFEITCEDAWNMDIINEELLWLWAHQCITYKKLQKAEGQKIKEARSAAVFIDVPGDKFTLYDEDYTVVMTEVDKEHMRSIGFVDTETDFVWQGDDKKFYLINVYEPNLGFVPAFRVGYVIDPETDGDTCVNGFHDAMPYLMKSIKTVSELDLSMALHAFPQKLQYVQKCPGSPKKPCTGGKTIEGGGISGGSVCAVCKGSGFKYHTSAQDAVLFPLPTDAEKTDMLDLDKMLVYKFPPVELLTFQRDYIQQLKADCNYAVFTKQELTKVTGVGATPVTATETNNNTEGVYDAVFPYTEKYCDVWILHIDTFGCLAGTPESANTTITCVFPADLKLKSLDQLLADLKNANDAGAPSFLIDKINNDIAEILYIGDELAEIKYKTKHDFYPFNGQTPDEIAMLMGSQYTSPYTKVLYANFEAIFIDIEYDTPDFYFKSYSEQVPIVESMVEEYKQETDSAALPALTLPQGDTGAGAADPAAADNNGGENTGTTLKPGDPGYVEPA